MGMERVTSDTSAEWDADGMTIERYESASGSAEANYTPEFRAWLARKRQRVVPVDSPSSENSASSPGSGS